MDHPPCDYCAHKGTKHAGVVPPNQEDAGCGAGRVEVYRCDMCGNSTRWVALARFEVIV